MQTATTFTLQGPRNGVAEANADEAQLWDGALTSTIEDNTGQDHYEGLDLDARPGWFTVKELVDETVTDASHPVAINEAYRIRPSEVPTGFAFGEASAWLGLASQGVAEDVVNPYQLMWSEMPKPETTDTRATAEQRNAASEDSAAITPLVAGPEPGVSTPYLHWDVRNAGNQLVGGASFDISIRTWGSWSGTTSFTDCVVAAPSTCPAESLDRDPDPGEFQLTHRNATTQLSSGSNYRVRQVNAPADNGWVVVGQNSKYINGTNTSASWGTSYSFGTYAVTTLNCVNNCSNLTIKNTVVGGTASAADWALSASRTNPSETYLFTSGQQRAVPRNATYTLAATATPEVQSVYSTTFSCSVTGTNVSVSTQNRTVQFPDSSGRAADCTFTHTYISHTIVMLKGDLRTGLSSGGVNTASSYVVGARFGLYESSTASTPMSECTILVAADGCRFENVTQKGVQLWVGELAPVPGSSAATHYSAPLGTLTTGTAGGFSNRAYRYATPTLSTSSPQTYTLPQASGTATGGSWADSSQRYANRLNNPQLNLDCVAGVDVALVMDLSGSVAQAGAAAQLRDAAKGFVDALGTNSSVALFSFGDTSPRAGTSNQAAPLNTGTQRPQIDAIIDDYYDNTILNQGTNWDAGMWQAGLGAASHQYDMVLVLTDGNPTFSGSSPDGTGSLTTFRELERSVFSANTIKQAGSRVVTVGIGSNLSNFNLAAVSGPQGYAPGLTLNQIDYVNTNWNALEALLEDFAKGLNCEAEITVKKMAAEAGEPLAPRAGWEFTASGGAPGTLSPAAGPQTTNASGEFTWKLTFTDPAQTGEVTVSEALPTGWSLTGLSCTLNNQVLEVGLQTEITLSQLGIGDKVFCTYTNVKAADPATVQVDKTWVITDAAGVTLFTYELPGDEAELPGWLNAAPTITGLGEAPTVEDPLWGNAYTGFTKDEQVEIGESAALTNEAPPGCEIQSQELVKANGEVLDPPVNVANEGTHTATLVTGENLFEITNTVTCRTQLTLEKAVTPTQVADTEVTAQDWQLTAASLGQATVQGNGSVTGSVAPATGYDLTETLSASAADEARLYVPMSDEAWSCTLGDEALAEGSWNASGEVFVPLGEHVTCTVTNVTAELTLLKYVEGAPAVDPGNWDLLASATDAALPSRPEINGTWSGDSAASGLAQATAANTIVVKPGESYSLTESYAVPESNLAYLFDRVELWNQEAGAWEPAGPEGISLAAGEHSVYRFVNKPAPDIAVPLTGGMSSASFGAAGTAITILAALMGAAAYMRRTQRTTEVE